ncbi:putative inactive cadmium/zinc-transporting ATPase HMA3 [Actinidia eriantha]|uniref:putative inactive cadmium/zinc-transporting ATPase HMA3 n=1 Tax=Actinidia eriantha TaxID=165200 RepID=UPI00258ADFD5|nr:putative inactive cadmium/zinc-transporting ATPase HMA3 [Actinidia eriantha]XP_057468408.1 putative inactive cadmium/zinc-transporting ATPase HMA3 [Actinidia eriantha]XP_057468409.1 putative inactive cadmium/zinc-transporting ATPase HMA3 [Actinidia eriantha]
MEKIKMGTGSEKNKGGTKKLKKSYFDVVGLCCSSEVPLIEKILKPLDGVKDVSVIVPSRTVIVVHDTLIISHLQIVKELNKARLEASVRVYGDASYQEKWPTKFAIASGVLVLLSFLKYVYRPLEYLALAAVVVGILPIILKGVAALRNRTLDTNILVLIAVIGSILLHDYWEAGSIVFLFTIAQWLETRASHKATAVMSSLMNIVPQKAVLAETGEEVQADEVMVGTILAVKAGEIIPIDGIVIQGKCEVDEKTLTGESFPVSKQNDSTVWGGTINLNGYISVRTTALSEDSVVARMTKLVEEAQNSKSKTQRIIDKCAKVYTPAVVIISACLAVVPAIPGVHNRNYWFRLALVVLVSACPCALVLSTPVATFCALSKAAISGVLIKGGEYLETLSKIKIVGFDKTGTITRGEFEVTSFQSLSDDVNIKTLLYWASSIESKSSHPMAAAFVDYGWSHSIEPKPEEVDEFENFPGEGIHGKIDGKDVYIGNRKIALRAGCATVPSLEGHSNEGKSIGYIFLEAVPAGIFSVSDACRTGAKEAINELKSMGIKTAMLTGDSNEAATLAQNQLVGALDVVHSALLPNDKQKIIKKFQKEAPTAMVGDGLNDAPALATADIGISMGISGSALANETGHVILMSNDIRKIPNVIQLGRRTRVKIIQNVFISILFKVAILAWAFAGHPRVWAAVLADVGTCLLVIFNSMLLLGGNGNKGPSKCCKSSSPAAHVHKHGAKSHGCHSSHNAPHEHGGCSDVKKTHTMSKRRESFLSKKCDNRKTSKSVYTNGCCTHVHDHLKEEKHQDHGSCEVAAKSVGSSQMHKHVCSGPFTPSSSLEKKCTSSARIHGNCVAGDGLHGAKSCDHNHRNHKKNAHDVASCSEQSHLNIGSSEITQNNTTNSHCHLTHCMQNHVQVDIVDEELHNVVETGCQDAHHEDPGEYCKGHVTESWSLCHSTTDVSSGADHLGCAATKACPNLGNIQIGGCCHTYRRKCCDGHLGATFRGGLTEIVIE